MTGATRFWSSVLAWALAASALGMAQPAPASLADAGGGVAAPVIMRQPVGATYSLSAQAMMRVQADSIDGGYLTYQWYQSALFATELPTTNGILSDAQIATIKSAGTPTLVGTEATLNTTTPATAGFYYYWVDITNNNDLDGNGTIEAGETAALESALVCARVVNRNLQPKLMNGDFQTYNYPSYHDSGGGTTGQWGINALGASALVRPADPVVPYWDSTHDGGASGMSAGKEAEIQQTGRGGVAGGSNPLTGVGHAETDDSVILYDWAKTAPLYIELSAYKKSSIYQDIATVPGKIYEWSLDFAAPSSSNLTEMIAVVIGPALNEKSDYQAGTTNRWVDPANYTVGLQAIPAGTYTWQYPYGKNLDTYFQDIVNAAGVSTNAFATTADGTAWRQAHNGDLYTVPYNGGTYYVKLVSDIGNNADWTHATGTYTVPNGQGTTVFGFVSVFALSDNGGNLLDNIKFASGSSISIDNEITYTGNASLSTPTVADYAYALAEIRGSTIINLSGLNATFNTTAASPDASLGTGAWYTPDAVGTLTFTDLTPGRTYRVIGIPIGSISPGLNTNMSPSDVLDSGYYQDVIMVPASTGDTNTLPSVTGEITGPTAATASVALTRTDTEYALLADSGGNPVTSGAGVPVAVWTPGTGDVLLFAGLSPNTTYHLISRPQAYSEVTYANAAWNGDGTPAGITFKTPAAAAVDVTPTDISRSLDSQSITVATKVGYTYELVDPATGQFVTPALTGDGTLQTFSGLDPTMVYQLVTKLDSDGVWMTGVRVYLYPDPLAISYQYESVSDTGLETGVVPSSVEYGIKTGSVPSWLAGNGADMWVAGTGTSSINLAANATGSTTSILDSIAIGASATLVYRMALSDGYPGAVLQPTLELPIPARRAAPGTSDYTIDYPDETLNTGAGVLQLAPTGSTAWTDIAATATPSLASLGWSGAALDFDIRLKWTSAAFASFTTQDMIVERPAAPYLTATSGTGTLIVGTFANGAVYEVSQGGSTWTSFTGTGGSETWSYDPQTSADYEVRLQATPTAPASYIATVSAPITLGALNFPSTPYGNAISALGVAIGNISPDSITLDSLQLVGGDAAQFTLSSGSLTVPTTGNTSYTISPVIPAGGLDVGTYQTSLVASYQVSGVAKTSHVNVTLTVTKIDWDLSKLQLSVDNVTPSSLTLNVAGAPNTSTIVFRLGSAAWSTPATAIGSNGLASSPYSGLTAATTYPLAVRFLGDKNHNESSATQVNGYTQWAAPASVDQVITVDYRNEVMKFNSGFSASDYEVKINGTVITNPDNYSLTTYANGADFTISVAHKTGPAATYYPASTAVTKLVAARLAGPTAGSISITKASSAVANDGVIALAGSFEYRAHRDASQAGGWAGATASTNVAYGTYDVRRPATNTVFASAMTTVLVDVLGVYKVTYSAGTGTGTPPTQTGGNAGAGASFFENTAVTVLGPGSLAKAGSVFTGWSVSPAVTFNGVANTTMIAAGDANGTKTFIAAANTTLTAQWEAKPTIVSVAPSGSSANAPISGTITIVFSEDMSSVIPGTVGLVLGGVTTTLGAGSWSDTKTYKVAYNGLSYSSNYTYTISGFARSSGLAMDANSGSLGFTTMADPARTVTSVSQYGGTDGKTISTGIMVTFNKAVTMPPASAFAVSLTASGSTTTVTKGLVSDGGDTDGATWVIGVTGDWVNGAGDVAVAVVANWGGYSVTPLSSVTAVPQMFAPAQLPFTAPSIDYEQETLTGLTAGYTYNYQYTNSASVVVTGTITTASGVTTAPIDAAWMTGVVGGFEIQMVAKTTDPYVDSVWRSLTIPVRRPASAVLSAGVTPISESVAGSVVGQITGLTTSMQYRTAAGAWKTFTGSGTYTNPTSISEAVDTITPLSPGVYYVRLNYTGSDFVSAAQSFRVRNYGVIDFGMVDEGYSPLTPLNMQDTINSYFTDPADDITVTDATLDEGANSKFVLAGTGSGLTLQPTGGLPPGLYDEAITISRVGTGGAFGLMSPTAQVVVNGLAAFVSVDPVLVDGGSTTPSSTLTVRFQNPIPGLGSGDFTISGGAVQAATPSVVTTDGGLTYTIAIRPTNLATRDLETINVELALPVRPGANGMTDVYAHQKITTGPTISTTANVRVPRAIDETQTLTKHLPGYATTFIQFTLKGDPYYPTPDLEKMVGEVTVIGSNANSNPGAATVDQVARVDESLIGTRYYTYRVYLSNVTAGDVSLQFATFISLNTSDYVTLTAGTSPSSRGYFLQTSTVDSSKYQNTPTDLTSGAQILPDVVVASGALNAPQTSFLTGVDLAANQSVTSVLLNGVALDASLWTATAAPTLDYSYDGGPWVSPTSPMLLTLAAGFTNLSGHYELDVIFSDDSYLFGAFDVTGIPATYRIQLSQSGTHDFGTALRGYTPPGPGPVSVANTGNQATGTLTVGLAGGASSPFTISKTSLASIPNHGSTHDAFTVVPKSGLIKGTYTDTVTVSGANSISASFGVRFEVLNSAPIVASGQGTHAGTAVPASDGGVNPALPYTVNLSAWFTDVDGDTLTYQVVSNDFAGTVNLNPTSGALTFTPVASDSGLTATIVVRANDGTQNSANNSVITIAVGAVAPFINPQPVSANYWTDTPTGSITPLAVGTTGSVGTLTYQWYTNTSASNVGGTPIGGATSANYKPAVSTPGTRYYYLVITTTPITNSGPAATIKSAVATIVATARPANAVAPTFAIHPASRIDYKTTGQTADRLTFQLNPDGNGTLTYQWYSSTSPSATSGTPISGATGLTFTPDISSPGTLYYFVEVTAYVKDAAIPLASRRSNVATITSANRQYTVEFRIGYDASYAPDILGEAPDPVRGDINTDIILPTNTGNPGKMDFSRVNYTFGGWDTIEDGYANSVPGNIHYAIGSRYSSPTDSAPITLHAAWIENFAVIFDTAGGNSIPGVHVATPTTYGAATGGTLPVPTQPGYDFEGWYLEEVDGTPVSPTLVTDTDPIEVSATQTVKLVAHWDEKSPVAVDFIANPARGGIITPTTGVLLVPPATGTISRREATANTGYTFTNWTDSTGTVVTAATTLVPIQNAGLWEADTYTANFQPITITVNFDPTGGTPVSSIMVDFDSPYGVLPTPIRAGWTFNGWYTTPSGNTQITDTTIMADNTTIQVLYAQWTENIYPVLKHFGTYSGTQTCTARIDFDDITQFTQLIDTRKNNIVDPTNYTVESGSTLITLTNAYLQTFAVGIYYFIAQYSNGHSDLITLTIENPPPTPPDPPGPPTPPDPPTPPAPPSTPPTPPKALPITGNPLPPHWLTLLALLGGIGLCLLTLKRLTQPPRRDPK